MPDSNTHQFRLDCVLALRMRLSRRRIQEFLSDWLSIELSLGVINKTITEGGRASEPIEKQFIEEIRQSELLHADETGWKENGRLVWLWVLVTANSALRLPLGDDTLYDR